MEGPSESHGKILAHDSRKPAQAGTSGEYTSETEDESMMNLKIGKRIEIEYERGMVFFVRLPLIGGICWTRMFGWERETRTS